MKKIRVAVIGLGKLGTIHAQIYSKLEHVELVSVCDIDPEKGQVLSNSLNTKFYTDYRLVISDKIDAVSIVVPTYLHYKIATFFLQNNIHVMIEKPITKELSEAKRLINLAKKKNLLIQVGHVERFNSAIQAIDKLSPKPRFIEVHRLGPFTPRVKDVGVVLDLMIHDIDIVLGFTKSNIIDIQAMGLKILTEHEDIANARLRFKNGTVCDLTASRVTNEALRKIRLFQEDCYISIDYMAQEAKIARKIKDKIVTQEIDIKKELPLDKELISFIDCIVHNKKPIVSGIEAYNALLAAHKIIKKLKI